MFSPQFAFIGSPLNRRAEWRSRSMNFDKWGKNRIWSYLRCRSDHVAFHHDSPVFDRPTATGESVFLGEDGEGRLWMAQTAQDNDALRPLRRVMMEGQLPSPLLAILAQARSLVHWHETHGFCANCGAETQMADLGYRRHCPACGRDHFPRTDPVVIMAVRHRNRLLLARQSSWAHGMYSALAGFVEPGESLEEAVVREVLEEVGVTVTCARYVASQPWPFPSSLMIGLVAEAQSDVLAVDRSELEDARWFDKTELMLMLERAHPKGLTASNPYAIAHHLVRTALREL